MKSHWNRAVALLLAGSLSLSLLAGSALALEDTEAPDETQETAETTVLPDDGSVPMPIEDEEDTDDGGNDTGTATETKSVPALASGHAAYMKGFPEGTFQPSTQLTRAEAAQLVYRLLEDPDRGTGTCSYTDVVSGSWYETPVKALCAWGLLDDGTTFRPNDIITRAEFVDLLVRLRPEAQGTASFTDVPADYWAAAQIGAAASLGWVAGYPDGTFLPDQGLTRAEACTVVGRMTGRTGDSTQTQKVLTLGLFSDVTASYWAADAIAEGAVDHKANQSDQGESWYGVDWSTMTFTPGFHDVGTQLFYVDKYGKLAVSTTVGAYTANANGALARTAMSYQMSNVPYISQIDDIYAWVGCEAVATLMGLKAKGYAQSTEVKTFLDNLPRSSSDPEKGFVGSPYVPDTTKKTRTTIYPAKLAEYSNTYCYGDTACYDFRGASVTDLQRELLAGNCVVAYMTLWWAKPYYRNYTIEGSVQSLVSNNHAVLVCGYDPDKGYYISDPYNYYNRGQVYQYWKDAATFESIWNARKVGMVIR